MTSSSGDDTIIVIVVCRFNGADVHVRIGILLSPHIFVYFACYLIGFRLAWFAMIVATVYLLGPMEQGMDLTYDYGHSWTSERLA